MPAYFNEVITVICDDGTILPTSQGVKLEKTDVAKHFLVQARDHFKYYL